MSVYNEVNGGSDSFSLGSLYDFAMEIRKADNCRFSNIMDPVFTAGSTGKCKISDLSEELGLWV